MFLHLHARVVVLVQTFVLFLFKEEFDWFQG